MRQSLHWRHNDHDGVSNHQPHGCLLNRLFRRRSKKTSKLRVTGLCVGNSPGPVNSPHKGPVTRKMFPFDDVIMLHSRLIPICNAFFIQRGHRRSLPILRDMERKVNEKVTSVPQVCFVMSNHLNFPVSSIYLFSWIIPFSTVSKLITLRAKITTIGQKVRTYSFITFETYVLIQAVLKHPLEIRVMTLVITNNTASDYK